MKKATQKGPRPIENDKDTSKDTYNRLLKELAASKFWPVILTQSRSKDKLCIDTLVAIDLFKEPTIGARMQGMRSGLFSLENEVNKIVQEAKEADGDKKKDKEIEPVK